MDKTDAEVTIEVLKNIAKEVDKMIKLTTDTPCHYEDKKMPVLDIKVNVNEEKDNQMNFEFYEKPTKNKNVILADAALNSAAKRNILTQECLRRLRNTKVDLGNEVRNYHLDNFMIKLKNSGYSETFRMQIVDIALNAFDKMLELYQTFI